MENNVKKLPTYFCAVYETESEICVPIKYKNHVYGVINSESEDKNYFSANLKRNLEGLADAFAYNLNRLGWSKKTSDISWTKLQKVPKYRTHLTQI